MVWKDTMAGVQQLSHVFHELKLKGWPNYLSHIKGRYPMAVIKEAVHWRNTFPHLAAFKLGVMFPRVFLEETPTAPPGAQAGARLPKHVLGSQQFPEVTLKPPTTLHKKKYLNCITTQMASQIFEDYTESIDQNWRNTPIHHRNEVWVTHSRHFKGCFFNSTNCNLRHGQTFAPTLPDDTPRHFKTR